MNEQGNPFPSLTPEIWIETFNNMKRQPHKKLRLTDEQYKTYKEIRSDGCSICHSIQDIDALIPYFLDLKSSYLPEDNFFLVFISQHEKM